MSDQWSDILETYHLASCPAPGESCTCRLCEVIEGVAQLETKNERLREAGMRLLSVLPDSVAHENSDHWEWCWNELDGKSQDEVKEARSLWKQALGVSE